VLRYQILAFPATREIAPIDCLAAVVKILGACGIKNTETLKKGVAKETSHWEIGTSKIFLKYHVQELLTEAMDYLQHTAVTVQRYTRGFLARKRVARLKVGGRPYFPARVNPDTSVAFYTVVTFSAFELVRTQGCFSKTSLCLSGKVYETRLRWLVGCNVRCNAMLQQLAAKSKYCKLATIFEWVGGTPTCTLALHDTSTDTPAPNAT
jgi:hypothetical protein